MRTPWLGIVMLALSTVAGANAEMRQPNLLFILTEMDPQSLGGNVPALELYDLQNDPDEMHNLIDDPVVRPHLNRLYTALCRWVKETSDTAVALPANPPSL